MLVRSLRQCRRRSASAVCLSILLLLRLRRCKLWAGLLRRRLWWWTVWGSGLLRRLWWWPLRGGLWGRPLWTGLLRRISRWSLRSGLLRWISWWVSPGLRISCGLAGAVTVSNSKFGCSPTPRRPYQYFRNRRARAPTSATQGTGGRSLHRRPNLKSAGRRPGRGEKSAWRRGSREHPVRSASQEITSFDPMPDKQPRQPQRKLAHAL